MKVDTKISRLPGVRNSYLFFFLVLAGFLISLAGAFLHRTFLQTEEAIRVASANEAQILASRFESTILRIHASSEMFANLLLQDGVLTPARANEVNRQLHVMFRHFPEVRGHHVYDPEGRRVCTCDDYPAPESLVFGAGGFNTASPEGAADLSFSETLFDPTNGTRTLFAAMPIRNERGTLLGVVATPLDLTFFEQLFSTLNVGSKGMVSLRRADTSRLAVRWPVSVEGLNLEALDIPPQKMMEQGLDEGVSRYVGRTDGIERVFAHRRVGTYPFYVLVGREWEEQSAEWRRNAWAVSGFTLLGLTLLGGFLVRLNRREADLHRSETQYRAIVDTQSDAVCRWQPDTTLTFANRRYLEWFGDGKELVGQRWLDSVPADERPELSSLHASLRKSLQPIFSERHTRMTDGRIHIIQWLDVPLRDSQGRCVEFQSVGRDVTGLRQAQQAERRNEDLLKFALEMSHTGGWDLDLENLSITRTLEHDRIFGYQSLLPAWTYADFLGHVVPEDRDEVDRKFQEANAGKDRWEFECRIRRIDGEIRWIWAAGRPILDATGHLRRRAGIIQDITDRKQSEKERERLNAQLIQAQKMESIGRLAGGVAHDYNNMLSVILGYSELALDRTGPSDQLREYLEEILAAAKRSSEITRQLLAFARKQAIQPRILDLNETIEGMLKMLRRLLGENIDLAWLPEARLWPVYLDASQVDQILANLTVNARDAITDVGRVTIETKNVSLDEHYRSSHLKFKPGDYVLLAVGDNGSGMDRDTLDKAFEPFFTTKASGKGTGLGLSTVYGIVQQNGGFINVYSESGRGTSFQIFLPRHRSGSSETTVEQIPDIPKGHGERVLVVEDELAILRLGVKLLEDLGYEVMAAQSPDEAMLLVTTLDRPVELLVTDVVMPGMNGRELANRLQEFYGGMKVLFISGYTADLIAHHGVLESGVHFVQKPFSKRTLGLAARRALDQTDAVP